MTGGAKPTQRRQPRRLVPLARCAALPPNTTCAQCCKNAGRPDRACNRITMARCRSKAESMPFGNSWHDTPKQRTRVLASPHPRQLDSACQVVQLARPHRACKAFHMVSHEQQSGVHVHLSTCRSVGAHFIFRCRRNLPAAEQQQQLQRQQTATAAGKPKQLAPWQLPP